MTYQPSYVDLETYRNQGGIITDDKMAFKHLQQASRHVDTLTFNRIVGIFDKLTEFQQEIIQEVICALTDFEYENDELISSVLSSYAINGVSMQIGASWNVKVQNGVAIPMNVYSLLEQTGLTYRGL